MDEPRGARRLNGFTCRSCGNVQLISILNLGDMPLANRLLTAEQLSQREPRYPLEFVFCPNCALSQITETVPAEILFREYLYFTSVSETAVAAARQLAARVVQERALQHNHLVIELASNDGYLLQFYRGAGIPVLGIEPAANIARIAESERGIPTVSQFFTSALAGELAAQGTRADVLHAHNVLAHVADTNDFVRGMKILLQDTGILIIEVASVKPMLDDCGFDQIYHEHLCYFSLTALEHLLRRHGLWVVDVEQIPAHGGSLRVFATHQEQGRDPSERVRALQASERAWGAAEPRAYLNFEASVRALQAELTGTLRALKEQGKRIAAYGAPGKGTILLNAFGIGKDVLDFVVDKSPHKQGRYVPGVHLPIYDPVCLLDNMPDYTMLLVWNLAPEILSQQAEYRRRGGKFILPSPHVEIA